MRFLIHYSFDSSLKSKRNFSDGTQKNLFLGELTISYLFVANDPFFLVPHLLQLHAEGQISNRSQRKVIMSQIWTLKTPL